MKLKNLVEKLEKNKYVRLFAIITVVLSAVITIGSFLSGINTYFYNKILISKNISDKVYILSAGQSINFFKQSLGSEKLQRVVSDEFTEYVFQYKTSYIQTLVQNDNNEVIYWAITDCGDSPVAIKRYSLSTARLYTGNNKVFESDKLINTFEDDVLLNKSSIKDIFKNEDGKFKYFVSGATANSFAYESIALGNPSSYLTFIVGINDICPTDIFQLLGSEPEPSLKRIQQAREKGLINTYGETSPFRGEEVLKLLDSQHSLDDEPYITFGVDRIRVRYFNE